VTKSSAEEIAFVEVENHYKHLVRTDRMFNRATSTKIFAPRRQASKEKYFPIFSELGLLCAFARTLFIRFPKLKFKGKFQNMFG